MAIDRMWVIENQAKVRRAAHRARKTQPFYRFVPKTLAENCAFRRRVWLEGNTSREHAKAIWIACRRDLLFYVNTFLWIYNPQDPDPERKIIPWITEDFQDYALLEIDRAITAPYDLGVEKSREMGASFMCVAVPEWRWHFFDGYAFLLVSRKEEYVDSTASPKSLFWKLDHFHRYQPRWLLPVGRWLGSDDPNRTKCHLANADTGSVIDGESTNKDVARGDRRSAVVLDEFAALGDGLSIGSDERVLASTQNATGCRIFNSTPQGDANAFYNMMETIEHKLTLHWTLWPRKAKGLYYEHGEPRSPWYDAECQRTPYPQLIGQELDISYTASSFNVFSHDVLEYIKDNFVRQPYHTGNLLYDLDSGQPSAWDEQIGGEMLLWFHPDTMGRPPNDRQYIVGCDVALGSANQSGHSNSALVVVDEQTGEQVAGYASPHIEPQDFGRFAVAVCRWFSGPSGAAFLIWEHNGPGNLFARGMLSTGFANYYLREDDDTPGRKGMDKMGWYTGPKNKVLLVGEFKKALEDREYVTRWHEQVLELRSYIYVVRTGRVEFSQAVRGRDPTGAAENHADRAVAAMLANKVRRDRMRGRGAPLPEPPDKRPGTIEWRRAIVERDEGAEKDDWSERAA